MGGTAPAATEVSVDLAKMRCMCCGLTGMEPATTTIVQQLAGVKVTVDGVPAMRRQACHGTSIDGNVMIPVDEFFAAVELPEDEEPLEPEPGADVCVAVADAVADPADAPSS